MMSRSGAAFRIRRVGGVKSLFEKPKYNCELPKDPNIGTSDGERYIVTTASRGRVCHVYEQRFFCHRFGQWAH